MAKKQSQKKKTPKATLRDEAELPLSLKLIRLLNCQSEQSIVAGRPLKKLAVKVICETGETVAENGVFLLTYRVGSDIRCANDQGDSEEGSYISAECRYEVHFLAARQPSTDEIKSVANTAAHCCWPYVRAFIATLLTQKGLPAIALPLLSLDAKHGMKLMSPAGDVTLQPKPE